MSKEKGKMPIKYFCDGLTPDMLKKAEEELGETEELRTQCLKDLRRLINDEPDFRAPMDDSYLLRYLRTRKFDVEKAFKTLQNYYVYKARYSGILTDFRPSDIKKILEQGHMCALEYRDQNYTGLGLLRIGCYDIDEIAPDDIIACALVAGEIGMEPDATQIFGYSLIFDLSGFNMRVIKHYASPSFLYRLVKTIQDIMPCRIKAVHIVNEPFYFHIIFGIIRTLLSDKLDKRLHIHGSNLKSLHKHISPDILPEELGGTMGPVLDNVQPYIDRILSRDDHFVKLNKYGYQDKTLEKLTKNNPNAIFT